jgi:4-amino-4-deoxychorismate lyase
VTAAGSARWWVDGVASVGVPADDRGLAYGDGVFETMAVVGGHVRLGAFHLERLQHSCARLGIPLDETVVVREVRERAAALGHGVIKLILTRGSGPRGYASPRDARPRRMLTAIPREPAFAALSDVPIAVRVCATPISINPVLAGIKHLNRLDQVLARSEWDDRAVADGLMLDDQGNVVCATAANVFAVLEDDVLVTPAVDRAGVAGVMRRAVLGLAESCGFAVRVGALPLPELCRARGILLSSSLTGLRDVAVLGDEQVPVSACGDRLRMALARSFEVTR